MANVKLTELTELTTPAPEDILVLVDDVVGTPTTKKVTEKNLYNARKLMSIVPAGDFTLQTAAGVQSAFPTTGDVFTLEASTTYEMEGFYQITKTTGSITTALAFAAGGGLTITSMDYFVSAFNAAVNTTSATVAMTNVNQLASTVINAAATTAVSISFKGLIRVNVAGTLTPQINFSGVATVPLMKANSYIKFTKIGTNTENVIGSIA